MTQLMKMILENPIVYLFRVVWRFAEGRRAWMVLYSTMFVISNLIHLYMIYVVGTIFNDVQGAIAGATDLLGQITRMMFLYIFLEFLFWCFHGVARIIEQKNAFYVRNNFRKFFIDKVLDLPIEWHKSHHSGDTINKIETASGDLYNFNESSFQMIVNVVQLFGTIIILLFFDYRASIVAFVVAILAVTLMTQFDKKLRKMYVERNVYKNKLAAGIQDYISNVYTIITLKFKSRVMREIHERSWNWFPLDKRIYVVNELKWVLVSMIIATMTATVVIMNARESYTATGTIALGTLFILYRYLGEVGNTFYNFAWQYGEKQREHASLVSAQGILDEHSKLPLARSAKLPKSWSTLEIKDLRFTYQTEGEKREHHISGVDVKLKKNSRIAFIGESGSGKSTVLALIRGLYFPEHGRLLADGTALPRGLNHLYGSVTLVPQDPELFNSTVRDNITMDTNAGAKDIEKMIRLAQFESVVARLPGGLETNVMEKGVSLSGGEKQRLALARGLLAARDSDFLLLDEPTSSVDQANELAVYENILGEFKKKTIIATIHRLHLLRYFDYIYMFSAGTVVAEGTLDEMLGNELFRPLWEKHLHATD